MHSSQEMTAKIEKCLQCPTCLEPIQATPLFPTGLHCNVCQKKFPVVDGVIDFKEGHEKEKDANSLIQRVIGTNDGRQRDYWQNDGCYRNYAHPVVEKFALQRLSYLAKLFPFEKIKSALDVGCGNGFSTYYMKKYVQEVWGLDSSSAMLSHHPLRGEGMLLIADARSIPFNDKTFDLVYGWEALHHISNPREVLLEMIRVSKRYLLIIEPNPVNIAQFLFAIVDREHRWVFRYRLSKMRLMLRNCNLKILAVKSGGWIFPNKTPLWLSSFLQKIPYESSFGISNWILAEKSENE
ncbi:MAG: class I SAM-dependent methyltransferase [Oligoflexia bacterium]|nr:class I SAM-dependent methyltransferase [Oligoflexia bacterium]